MSARSAGGQSSGEGVQLYAFTVGWIMMPLSFFLAGASGQIRVPATAYLIDHPRGLALFDTGLGKRFAAPSALADQLVVELAADETIDGRLRALVIDPAAIPWIICSHLHTDHAGGNACLPNATVIIQDAEYDYALSGVDPAYHRPEFDTGQLFKRVSGEHDRRAGRPVSDAGPHAGPSVGPCPHPRGRHRAGRRLLQPEAVAG